MERLNFVRERDFNVRMSVLDNYPNFEDQQQAYVELVRDSLGSEIVNSASVWIGNYSILYSDNTAKTIPLETRGITLMGRIRDEIKKSDAIRINLRMKQGGFKSWIVFRNIGDLELIKRNDFNVRNSVLDGQFDSISEKMKAYFELVRDSLGSEIVSSQAIFMGNYTIMRGDGSRSTRSFQLKGTAFMANMIPELRKSVAIRINMRMRQGGFKSWVISQ